MNDAPKYQHLAEILRQRVLISPSGMRLPSLRSLMKRHGCSLQTVTAALGQLRAEQLIVSRRGSGIFVSDRRITRLVAFHQTRFGGDGKEGSLAKAVRDAGWHFEVRRHTLETIDTEIFAEHKACAHVINADLVNTRYPFFQQVVEQKVPVVILGREADTLNFDSVTGNDRQILNKLIRHLKELGHRQMAFLINEPEFFEVEQRKMLFLETLEVLELPKAIFIPCNTALGASSSMAAHTGLKKYLGEHSRLNFSAVICCSQSGSFGALRALHEAGLNVPGQISVACFGMQDENVLGVPAVTDAGLPIEYWGKWAVQLIKERLSGSRVPPISMKIPCVLNVRESTGRAKIGKVRNAGRARGDGRKRNSAS